MRTHGDDGTRLHTIWAGVISRCEDRGHSAYQHYGGRGISICAEWRGSYVAFRDWALANGYAAGLELDRKENSGNYGPGNCRWATRKQNMRNRRGNVMVSAFGEVKTIADWVDDERCSVEYDTLRQRIKRYGWKAEDAILTPKTRYVFGEGRVAA
jgi:hypothetical protein